MGKYTSQEIRQAIVNHRDRGLTQREIASLLGVGLSTVNYWWNRHLSNVGLETKRKEGRKRKTDKETDKRIFRMADSNPFVPATELRQALALQHISDQTVRNRLKEKGLKCHVPATKETLTDHHKQKRLEFALRFQHWTVEQWVRVIFSDEKRFCSSGFGPLRVWRPAKRHRYDDKYIRKRVVSGRFSIPVWACISGSGAIDYIHRITDPTLTSDYYITNILENLFAGIDTFEFYFVHDKSPIHTARAVQTWLQEHDVHAIPWPAKAPDLNPIENVWAEMERRTADRRPQTADELWNLVVETFYALERDYIRNLIRSMPNRIQKVIEAEGAWTKY